VKTSLNDTDSKYDGLWKIYVFITDSLYYTGILGKLKNPSAIGQPSETADHQDRLETAQAFVIAALKSVCEEWQHLQAKHRNASELERQLSNPMPLNRFKLVLASWSLKYRQPQVPPGETARNFSGVNLEHYVHGWDLDGHCPDGSCRDIRYKADVTATELWDTAKGEPNSSIARVVHILEQGGFTDPTRFSELEIKHIVALFDRAGGECKELPGLIALWKADMPEPTREVIEKAPTPPAVPREPALPTHREGVRKFLQELANRVPGHVPARFSTYLTIVLDAYESKSPAIRERMVQELRESLLNESGLLNSNMKEEHMMTWLESFERTPY
jgi:hypothetical protein